MSTPVVWILAIASTALLIAGGFTLAVARFRSRVLASRRLSAKLGAQLESKPSDPFGELAVIGDQLRKIQQRLGQSEDVAGLPVQSPAGSVPAAAAPGGALVTVELEQDLDLYKKEVYTKTRRIDELAAEKQVLAEKIVVLENALAAAPAPREPARKVTPTESNMDLVDVLQQEADELRNQITERDQLLRSLEKSDTSGLVKEVRRIRQELLNRNEEVSSLGAQVANTGQTQQLQLRLDALEREKEGLAARALESSGQLRVATQRIAELEQILISNQSGAPAGAARAPQPPVVTKPLPTAPRVPMPQARPAPPPPPPRSPGAPNPPQRTLKSPGFPDEPTVKSMPPRMDPPPRLTPPSGMNPAPRLTPPPRSSVAPRLTPPPRPSVAPKQPPPVPKQKRRHTGSIFPAPRSKKDLLD